MTELVITTFAASDYELRHGWVSFPLLDFAGADSSWFQDPYRPRQGSLEGNLSEYEGYFYWAFSVDFNSQQILIEYYVQTGPNASVLAWVEDSYGNEYTIPVTIIYAGIQD